MQCIFQPSDENIDRARQLIESGSLVAFPTETVYGLGADATNDHAVAQVFAVKGRPKFNPLISHFTSIEDIQKHADLDKKALLLAEKFWPGPMTLIVRKKETSTISKLASAGLPTIAVRIPKHSLAQQFLKTVKRPIVAPSANKSGFLSPTQANHVYQSLGDRVDMILDGGECHIGLESTVIDLSSDKINILRPGAITIEDIMPYIENMDISFTPKFSSHEKIKSPGQLTQHYSPELPLRINVDNVFPTEALIAFGPKIYSGAQKTVNLSETGDLVEAAANLFSVLHSLDKGPYRSIAVMPIPNEGIGIAINDRLMRAAHKDE